MSTYRANLLADPAKAIREAKKKGASIIVINGKAINLKGKS